MSRRPAQSLWQAQATSRLMEANTRMDGRR